MKRAVLLFSCPDQKGIVAKVAGFVFEQGGNILHAEEHLDVQSSVFLMRVEFEFDQEVELDNCQKSFDSLANQLQMEWQIYDSEIKPRIAIMVSKQLHCLADLLFRYKNQNLPCEIAVVVSNHPEASQLCQFYEIPFCLIEEKDKTLAEQKYLQILNENKVELVVLARFMQILSADFVEVYSNRVINIHHSFLPSFVGAKPYHQAFDKGVKLIGATGHFVTAELDQGPIIEQDVIRVSHRETAEEMVKKGQDIEQRVLFSSIKAYLEHRILIYQGKTVVFS